MSDEVAVPDPNRVTKYIWRNIGKRSAREMAQELGVSPEEILRAKRELVEEVDDLTLQVQKAKLVATLQELADDAQERSLRISDEFYSGTINSAVGAIKAVLVELNRASKGEQEAITHLNSLRVRELLDLMNEVIERGVDEISEEHGLDKYELFEIFNRKLSEAATRRGE